MIHIRPMTEADLPVGLGLSRQAGWNQIPADWRRFLELQPDGCFVAEWNGTVAGTTTTCIFGPVAWIAMVLVAEPLRGQGIGRALLNHALEFLDRRQVPTVRLDATPLGQPLYERLGFVEQYRLARYGGTPALGPEGAGCKAASADDWEALAALDQEVTGIDRRRLLFRLFAEQPESVRLAPPRAHPAGFLAARLGSLAVQVGPCIGSPEVGPVLLADACHRLSCTQVFLDIPVANVEATRLAESGGLAVQRHLTRMCRGVPRCESLPWVWASSGPEKG
jgi:GNAT superfamily N-acetyltransferase